MYKQLRKTIASTVSDIDQSEIFEWHKWIRQPHNFNHSVDPLLTALLDTEQYNSWLQKPEYQSCDVVFPLTDVLPDFKKDIYKKVRTNAIFYGFGLTDIKKIEIPVKEFLPADQKSSSNKRKSKNDPGELVPSVKVITFQLEGKVLKFNLLKADSFLSDKKFIKDIKANFDLTTYSPKIFKVKVPLVDKSEIGTLYFLLNINLQNPKLVKDFYGQLDVPDTFQQDLRSLGLILPDDEVTVQEEPVDILENIEVVDEPVNLDVSNEVESIENEIDQIVPSDVVTGPLPEEAATVENEETVLEIEEPEPVIEEEKPEPVVETEEKIEYKPEVDKSEIEEVEEKQDEETEEEYEESHFEKVFDSLYSYQETGAEFLIDEKFALLSDDLGLGKTVQAVSALKNLFDAGRIKTAVIVCPADALGSKDRFEGMPDGWIGHINTWASGLTVNLVTGAPHDRSLKWKDRSQVFVTAYESFLYDIEENLIEKKKLKSFGCLIFDEAQNLFIKELSKDKLSKSIKPEYIWALSSYPEETIKDKLKSVFTQKISVESSLKRTSPDVLNELPVINWQENWLEMDEMQQNEYADSLMAAKEKVSWLLESGNPLRFQANIFTILHQLKQVCNFANDNNTSPKAELLLRHVDIFDKNNKKVIIFSQYDKAGTKKIEKLLKKNSVKYVSYAPGMSTKEMETAVKTFAGNDSVTALVAGVKPSRIKIPVMIPYIIHFDQWWNPAFLWQTEDAVLSSVKKGETSESINIYSYLAKGTIDEKIRHLLYSKGLLNKSLMDLFNAESIGELIANEEWLEVFDMPDDKFIKKLELQEQESENKLISLGNENFADAVKIFFTKLGFKNLNGSISDSEYFDLKGTIKKTNSESTIIIRTLLNDFIDDNEIKSNISDLKEKARGGRIFILTKGYFEENVPVKFNPRATLIDRKMLANYFHLFRVV